MATKIRGITLEIGGDTQALSKSLSGVNKEISDTQKQLKDVERLLKMDPGNIELLRQKQQLLGDQVGNTAKKLEELKKVQDSMDASGVDRNSEQYMALQREIIATTQSLDDLEAAAQRSNATLAQVGATADKIAAGAGKVASATKGMSTVAAGALAGIGGLAYKAVTASDDLNTLAKQSGFTTAELQKMEYAADRIDVSMDDITSSAQKLKKNMGSESGGVADAFARLGVNVRDSNGAMRDSTEVYWEVISALSKVSNETERDQLAMELLGKGADSLAGIIDDGGAALRQLGDEAEAAGLIMSQETLDSLNSVNDKIDELKAKTSATLSQSGAKALEAALPMIETLLNAQNNLLLMIGGMSEGQMKFVISLLAVMAAISPVASLVGKLASAVSFFTTTILPALKVGLAAVQAGFAAVSAPVLAVVAAIVAVIAAIAIFGDQIQSVLGSLDSWLQGVFATDWTEIFGGTLGSILNAFFQNLKNIWDSIKLIFDGIIDFIRGVFTGDWKRAWEGVKEMFSGIFGGLAAVAKAPINAVIGLINSAIESINWFIRKANAVTSKIGINIGTIGTIPLLAKGGILSSGAAIVGEAGPELLTVSGGRAIVQPLTATVDANGLRQALSGLGGGTTQVNIEFTGSLAQLGKVLRPVISNEASRIGGSLITY